jgi:hypothetical protein
MATSDTPAWKKLLWLMAIWAVSVAALAVVAYGMKLVMRWAGLAG